MKLWRWWVFGLFLAYGLAAAWIKLNLDHCAFVMPLFDDGACRGWVAAWRWIWP
jgi:hypothetical protein